MLAKLVHEDIKAKHKLYTFGKAKYGDLEVVVLKEKGYINATKMCALGGKAYKNWSRLDSANDLFKEVSLSAQKCSDSLSIQITGNQAEIIGTYLHQDIIVHVASWVSPKFAIMVSKIVNDFLVTEYKSKLKAANKTITSLETKVDNQTLMIEDQKRIMEKQLEKIDHLLANSEYMQSTLDDVRDVCKSNMNDLDDLNNKVEVISEYIVLPEVEEAKIDMLKVTLLDTPVTEDGITYNLYISKGQRMSIRRKTLYKGTEILAITTLPNAQALFNKIKRELTYVNYKRCLFCVNGKSQDQFLEDIKALNESRFKLEVPKLSKKEILNKKTLVELKDICRKVGYFGFSNFKTKETLITFMLAHNY